MDELRVVRREDNALIVATELGDEYRLTVDDALAAEIRQLTKRTPRPSTVRPREIQTLLRSGMSRLEVADKVGLEEADVERFEEPVRAEQRYILELAHAVPVRTDAAQLPGTPVVERRFGEVISERLVSLGNVSSTWRSWREEETGWLIGLAFDSRDGEHDAVWSFDHRKRVLTPLSPDATNLSKLGDVGDRLIPKLRVVDTDSGERFDSDAFDPDALLAETAEHERHDLAPSEEPAADLDAEYERRREIDHLAVKTSDNSAADLSQTADLLDALRRRRGERTRSADPQDSSPATLDIDAPEEEVAEDTETATVPPLDTTVPATTNAPPRSGIARNIWGASGVSASDADSGKVPADRNQSDARSGNSSQPAAEPRQSRRGRSSIPSWDDILFGTRSDDDPA